MNAMTHEEFRAVYGVDPRTLRPEVRVAMMRKAEAATSADSEASKFRKLLELRHGSVEAAPAVDRASLAHMEGPRVGAPKPVAAVSLEGMAKQAEGELEQLEAKLADMERVRSGESVNLRMYRQGEADRLRDRIAGIRRRA